MLSDYQWSYDQVFALYLIDVADTLQMEEVVKALAFKGELGDPVKIFKKKW